MSPASTAWGLGNSSMILWPVRAAQIVQSHGGLSAYKCFMSLSYNVQSNTLTTFKC